MGSTDELRSGMHSPVLHLYFFECSLKPITNQIIAENKLPILCSLSLDISGKTRKDTVANKVQKNILQDIRAFASNSNSWTLEN